MGSFFVGLILGIVIGIVITVRIIEGDNDFWKW
jgi:hypothetical protein